MKAAIVVLSDPKSQSEESLGRVFNAMASALDFKQQGDEVTVLFQGAGTRWLGELTKDDHLLHKLFCAVEDKVAGVSSGCADVFGGGEEAEQAGYALVKENMVPGTSGLPSLRRLAAEGYAILTF